MSITKEEARQQIGKLVAKYRRLDGKAIRRYGEANTRRNFIEPLFQALGWNIYNREEVTEEENISRKRVDYAFRLRGIPKFFLEAKSLKADLNKPEYAKQAINYAYHKGTTWAVLTDFEGLKVFNAEWKESIVSRSLFFELSYDEYLSRFDWLWLLSREAFEQNLLDQKALELFKKTKKTPVGQQLFSDLVSWRGLLDKYLSAYNKKYHGWLIDEAVQRILDRLIFIRTCEDRETESPILRPLLREWQNGAHKNLAEELKHIWRDFDQGYDSRLFLPHLADELECDPTPFAEIIEGLYTTKDRSIEYDFNAIDADVLGGIYEQYLEHLIKRTGKEIKVIPERGKRKAQGIYYTPKFVVRYIVENTLRPTLEGKSLSEARKIKILDPACGSGSFLVEALDYLERHWRQQKWLPQSSLEGDVKQKNFFDYLARVQFLTQNLYGVDLDTQAVEIAQLNLLLKALNQRQRLPNLVNNIRQGNSLISGTEEELKGYFGDKWREKKPFNWEQEFSQVFNQGKKTGTLTVTIDTNAINAKQEDEKLNLLEQYSQKGLAKVFKTDVLDTELLTDKTKDEAKRKEKASTLPEDIGVCVLDHSRLGHTRLAGEEDAKLQDEIIKVLFQKTRHQLTTQQLRDAMHLHTHLLHQRDFFVTTDGHFLSRKEELHKKFGINAGTPEECLQLIEGFLPKGFDVIIGNPPYVRPHKLETSDKRALWAQYKVYRAKSDIYACFIQRAIDLLKPGGYTSYIVSNTFMSLESFASLRKYILDTCCILYFGLTPKKVFEAATVETIVLGLKKESNESARRQNKTLITEYRDGTFEKIKEIPQEIFYSTYLNIFDLSWGEAALPFSTKIELNTNNLSETVTFCYGLKTADDAIFLTHTPTTPEHKSLLRRSDFGRYSIEYKGEFVWYVPDQMRKHRTTARPGSRERFEMLKILIQDIGRRLVATLDNEHFYVKDALMLHRRENGLDLKFVLALINSKLLNYWYAQRFPTLSVAKNAILQLPIHRVNLDNPTEKQMHDDLVALVDRILELNKRLAPICNTPCNERDELLREISHTDNEIDNLVYDLYGLTEVERKIVEGDAKAGH